MPLEAQDKITQEEKLIAWNQIGGHETFLTFEIESLHSH